MHGCHGYDKKMGNFFFAENGHCLWLFLGTDRYNFPIQGFVKNLPAQEDNGIKGLPLRGRRRLPFHRQVGKKTLHIPAAKISGMGLAAKEIDETQYPTAGIMMIA